MKMSSLTDNDFDEKLDRLLAASVSPGAEPEGFSVVRMPQRPRFNWVLFGGAAAGIVLAGVLLLLWLLESPMEEAAVRIVPGQDLWMLLSAGITSGAENLSSPTFLLYTAAIMAMGHLYTANRIMRLYRRH
jgi:hypothetical protein